MAVGKDFVTIHLDSGNGILQVREFGDNESIGRGKVSFIRVSMSLKVSGLRYRTIARPRK